MQDESVTQDSTGGVKGLAAMAEHVRVHDVHDWVSGQLAMIAARGATAREPR
jgi:hypothetical protein